VRDINIGAAKVAAPAMRNRLRREMLIFDFPLVMTDKKTNRP
jgi:hypothetical protein